MQMKIEGDPTERAIPHLGNVFISCGFSFRFHKIIIDGNVDVTGIDDH